VIAAYVWTSRLYNGEFSTYDNPEDVAGMMISLSSFLGKDMVFMNFEHAMADVSLNACRVSESLLFVSLLYFKSHVFLSN
jgi:hypothetical protein